MEKHPIGQGYQNPEILVEPAWLQKHLENPEIRVLDCDVSLMYERGHIPGASGIPSSVHHYLKEPAETGREYGLHVMSPHRFEPLMSELGIGPDTLVVTYDSSRSLYATRAWWTLKYHGHKNVVVLNGGWDRWVTERRPVAISTPSVQKTMFHSHLRPTLLCDFNEANARVNTNTTTFWDVRTKQEWTGDETRGNRRSGHIPNAIHLEWSELMTDDSKKMFRPASEMRERLEAEGITPEKQIITY
jgi:thiosulfate/3-mercaptopyruvate sulfurtransferase